MEPTEQLSLSWHAHQKNICSGLSVLQQRGEFVDMTLAADGHHVKVHQMVMSLVSPYIKELISSAHCPHPIIFLNNISYTTLCAILEYIYTGEVLVAKNKLSDLIAAGKALHIKGLREMDVERQSTGATATVPDSGLPSNKNISKRLKEIREKRKTIQLQQKNVAPVPICKIYLDETSDIHEDSNVDTQDESMDVSQNISNSDNQETLNNPKSDSDKAATPENSRKTLFNPKLQYTVSIQGGLQAIYNRYIYHLRYFGKKNRKRLWRCVDYTSDLKCSANILTDENNQVVQRSFTHNHPFHDSKILKKLSLGIIYSVFQEAENIADSKKKERGVQVEEEDQSLNEISDYKKILKY